MLKYCSIYTMRSDLEQNFTPLLWKPNSNGLYWAIAQYKNVAIVFEILVSSWYFHLFVHGNCSSIYRMAFVLKNILQRSNWFLISKIKCQTRFYIMFLKVHFPNLLSWFKFWIKILITPTNYLHLKAFKHLS